MSGTKLLFSNVNPPGGIDVMKLSLAARVKEGIGLATLMPEGGKAR